jgi:putative ABC transport system permease protein
VQSIFGLEEQITGVGIKVHRDADVIAYEERLYGLPDVQVVSMAQVKNTISTLVATARVMVMSITIIAILISMIGVINTILMSVLERYQEIGIMKTMGATTFHIFRIIWFETFMICIIGGLVGALGAVLLANGTDSLIRFIMPYSPTNTMIHITSELVLKSLGIITLIGLFSGIYPAYKATIITPIDAIKSEGEI